MKIGIVTPAPPRSRYGNRVTALRWARILKGLGNSVSIKQEYDSEPFDLLIALHARRSYPSLARFLSRHPNRPAIVALTGTDLYRDLRRSRRARDSLDLASRIIVLQPKALEKLRPAWREKTRVIYQSVTDAGANSRSQTASTVQAPQPTIGANARRSSYRKAFRVCVIGHLRPVKDPFRAAMAARLLPASSRIRVLQLGAAMTNNAELRAKAEMKRNSRYRWLREQPPWRVRQILKQSRLCVLSSRIEGGANALGEAIVAGTPVLASRIPGSLGILGEGYPGYFEAGDTDKLRALMTRAENNPDFLAELRKHCRKLLPRFDPAREERAWAKLLNELFEPSAKR